MVAESGLVRRRGLLFEVGEGGQDFRAVRVRVDLRVNLANDSAGIDQEGVASRDGAIRSQRTVAGDHRLLGIRQKFERQVFLGAELLMRIDAVSADANDGSLLRRVLILI